MVKLLTEIGKIGREIREGRVLQECSLKYNKYEISIRHPRRYVSLAVRYLSLDFGEVRSRIMNFGITCRDDFKTMDMTNISYGELKKQREPENAKD